MRAPITMRRKQQRGSTIIEVAVSFLLFFVVLCAIMEFGWIVSSYNILAGATREGARYAIVHGSASGSPASSSDIQDVVRRWCIGLNSSSVAVTTTWAAGNGPGQTVQVQSRYAVAPLTGMIFLSGLTIGSSSQMNISQ